MSKRQEAFIEFADGYHGKRLMAKLSPQEAGLLRAWLSKHDVLPVSEFEQAVNRMFLTGYGHDGPKPKQWAVIMEILSCVNTRAFGIDRKGFVPKRPITS